jgi:outer membrane lipoprotein-sorting protein
MKRRSFLVGGAAVLAAGPKIAFAQAGLSAHEMMKRNFMSSKIKAFRTAGRMTLINDRGETRARRTTTISMLQPNGIDSKLLVRFSYPPDINGTAFLQIEHIAGEDDQWIYLPALGRSRRLVANNKKDSFVGSDFSYGDISLPNVDLYDHRLLGSELVDRRDSFKIESTPKAKQTALDSGYSRKITWLNKQSFVETKVEYYDLSNRLLKTQKVGEARLMEPDRGRWFPLHREMANQQTGHRTLIDFDQVSLASDLRDDMFTTRFLERG